MVDVSDCEEECRCPRKLVLGSRIGGDQRKKDTNRRAMFFLVPAALNGDPASMPLNELFRDKEPDTRADRCMRRKERVKDSRQILRTNANAVISHCERHTLRLGFTVANVNLDGSAAREGVDGICKQI